MIPVIFLLLGKLSFRPLRGNLYFSVRVFFIIHCKISVLPVYGQNLNIHSSGRGVDDNGTSCLSADKVFAYR